MSTKTVAAEVAVETETKQTKRKTLTNWSVFDQIKLVPVKLQHTSYKGNEQPSDLTCHTTLVPSIKSVEAHADPEHGSPWFQVKLRVSENKSSTLWKDMEEAGFEIQELWCPHCRKDVPVSPRQILFHLNFHPGALRHNLYPQTLCMTLSKERPDQDEMESLYDPIPEEE